MNTTDELFLQQINDPDFSAVNWNPPDIDKLILWIRENRGTPVKKVTARTKIDEPEIEVAKITLKDLGIKPAPKLVIKRRV